MQDYSMINSLLRERTGAKEKKILNTMIGATGKNVRKTDILR